MSDLREKVAILARGCEACTVSCPTYKECMGKADAILALVAEERKEYTEDGYCYFRDKWEEERDRAEKAEAREAALREALEGIMPFADDATKTAWDRAVAALASVKDV